MKAVVFAYHDMGCTGIQSCWTPGDIAAIFTHPITLAKTISLAPWRLAAEQVFRVGAGRREPSAWIERIREMKPDVLFSFYYRNLLGDEISIWRRKGRSTCTVRCCQNIAAARR